MATWVIKQKPEPVVGPVQWQFALLTWFMETLNVLQEESKNLNSNFSLRLQVTHFSKSLWFSFVPLSFFSRWGG